MFNLLQAGGITMIPLSILAIIALAIIFDKIFFYRKLVKIPQDLTNIIEKYKFDWQLLKDNLEKLPIENCYRKFFSIIIEAHQQSEKIPIWWIESRAGDEAKIIEKKLNQNLWILETIITTSPLLGLLGTIIGMMSSFKIIGIDNIANTSGITSGVAESLIATGFGLLIAIIALFAFNYFSKQQSQAIDEMERLATKLVDHIRIDRNHKD